MAEEENKTTENAEQQKSELSYIERAEQAADRLGKQLDEMKKMQGSMEQTYSKILLAGRSEAGIAKKEETQDDKDEKEAKEWVDKFY